MANGDSFDRMEKIAKTWSQKAKGRRAGGEQGVEEFPSFSSRPCPLTSPAQDTQHTPEHRLHKHSQGLYVDPGNKGLAEVHLEPAQQRSLRRWENGMSLRTLS